MFFSFCCCVFWRVWGSGDVARRATSLGPKPSLFVLVFFYSFVLLFCFLVGGFKGQVRWPKGPPHLDINPPYLFALFCFFFFLSLFPFLVLWRETVPPLSEERALLFIFQLLSLPFSLSLSLSLLFFSFFLPFFFHSCVILPPCFCLFVYVSCVFACVSWMFGEVEGCNKPFVFHNLCFAKSEKLSFGGGHFLAKFGWCSKTQ